MVKKKKVMISISVNAHRKMKRIAARNQRMVSGVYEDAVNSFLKNFDNSVACDATATASKIDETNESN